MARPAVSDDAFRAIADRTRWRIVELLAQRPHSPSELAAEYDSCQSTISEHLGVLRRGGRSGPLRRHSRATHLLRQPVRLGRGGRLRRRPTGVALKIVPRAKLRVTFDDTETWLIG
ncbi:ArsR family transcriptional regulator [Streptomyces sp. NBC_00183]|uniref:ArsR/SmtB family transcription factor n=1 Tax=unclassified Streptomyces TaxID=2593676 RepID=UPI00338E0ABB